MLRPSAAGTPKSAAAAVNAGCDAAATVRTMLHARRLCIGGLSQCTIARRAAGGVASPSRSENRQTTAPASDNIGAWTWTTTPATARLKRETVVSMGVCSSLSRRPGFIAGRSARRQPKRENVRFFPTAAAAQEAGFRPCLRCRPETSPELAFWRGSSNTVSRALGLIEAGALDDANVEALATRLGIGERQLRRLFRQHLGASPISIAQTRRILLAKQLIQDTRLPMTEVASAAGFGSIRRFNEIFQQLTGGHPRHCAEPA